ncbi:DUF6795 domain-containing protein [Gimesia algae]|uniref:DUF6795 domain-containing protein n=1 Tax=Gimesia algae TaxID=2527971 RepID=A0A517VLY4_9PLAN|nr:carboxypeptidase-like regulatory domain-containing protein [Gimesia algae]QDT94027.1 hypothetical protein Pan161_57190 [Gimesia algae]
MKIICALCHSVSMAMCAVFLFVSISGCSGGGETLPELTEVTGTVTLDGKPVENISVIFQPEVAEQATSRGTTNAEGKFSLMYNQDASGAVPGIHKVRFAVMDADSTGLLPDKYTRPNTGETANVKAEGSNDFQFELKSR